MGNAKTFNSVTGGGANHRLSVMKSDDEKRLVFGWASVAVRITGEVIEDYLTDAKAIQQMMGTLADYAAGMSGGIALSEAQMVEYATQLGKALNAEDAAFDGLKKKGFAVSDAQEKILKTSLTSDLEKTAVLSDIISQSWDGLAERLANTPTGKITQMGNKWGDISETIGKKLEPSTGRFFSMLDSKLPAIGNLLTRGAESLGSLIDRVIPMFDKGIDWMINGIDRLGDKISDIIERDDFQGAGLFGKAKIVPFPQSWTRKRSKKPNEPS